MAVDVFEVFAKLILDTSDYDKKIEDSKDKTNTFADVLKANLATMAIRMAIDGLKKLGEVASDTFKSAIEGYANYEQLIGGTELMFGDAYDYIVQKSQDAYKNVQMSQNEYLQQVNGFAVGLKNALGGNEQAAAELANKIITAEADIVAATGQSQEAVQNAFNGIMKSNYTMLDNLQIGIKPTKEGMQEVIDTVNEWNAAQGRLTEYTIDNLADQEAALVDYIDMVGMAGYAHDEAADTVQGSLSSMKAAWQNLIAGLGNDKADIDKLLDEFFDSLETAWENIKPVADRVIDNMIGALVSALPRILDIGIDVGKEIAKGILKGLATILLLPAAGILKLLDNVFGGGISDLMGMKKNTNTYARASGGFVSAGQAYKVGEFGTEVFVPSTNGQIYNAKESASMLGGGVTINIQGDVYDDERSMRNKMKSAVLGVMQEQVAYG